MAQRKRLEKIFDSRSTLSEAETANLLRRLGEQEDWICFGDRWTSLTVNFAESYINSHATVPGILGPLYSSQPIHIGRILKDPEFGRIDAMLYANGAVVVQTKDAENREIYVWIEKRYADLFGYTIMPQ